MKILLIELLMIVGGLWVILHFWGKWVIPDDQLWMAEAFLFGWVIRSVPWLDAEWWKQENKSYERKLGAKAGYPVATAVFEKLKEEAKAKGVKF